MQQTMVVKPKENLKIVDPVTGRALPPEGAKVVQSSYWLRRIAEGDVIEMQEQTKSEEIKSGPKNGGSK